MSAGVIADFKGEGGDPRLPSFSDENVASSTRFVRPQDRLIHDSNVSFEEYRHYALKTRADEDLLRSKESELLPKTRLIDLIIPPKSGPGAVHPDGTVSVADPHHRTDEEKRSMSVTQNLTDRNVRMHISDEEWKNASRALRTATAAACFYLITTDILGPFGVGFAIGTLGWGPGIALFTVFGLMAGYSGYLLWKMFLGLDSYEFPLKNYGDLALRIFGPWFRHLVDILQCIQLLCSVGLIIISNGQAISLVSKFRLCYTVCCLIWAIVGFAVGQVRTLQKYGWLANAAVWLNLMIMFISMGVIAHSPPYYAVSGLGSAGAAVNPDLITPINGKYPAIVHFAGLPDPNSLIGSINGLMQGVYAYGGAQLFINFMAEMRQPRDFIKAMWGAQFFIYTVYMVYGCFCYYYQGQYTYQLSYQGVSPYGWQTAGNILAVLSGIIAAGLYGNIGIKVFYNQILMDLLKAPPLTTKKGKILWAVIVPVYWSVAFVVAASIPDFFGLVSVVAAFCVIQFCYSFPPLMAIGYYIKLNAIREAEGEGFDAATGKPVKHDAGPKRWVRGFFAGGAYQVGFNIWNVIFMLGSFATAGLGAYAAIQGMIDVFANPQVNAFTCKSPLNIPAA